MIHKIKTDTAAITISGHCPRPGSLTRFKPFIRLKITDGPEIDLTPQLADLLGYALMDRSEHVMKDRS